MNRVVDCSACSGCAGRSSGSEMRGYRTTYPRIVVRRQLYYDSEVRLQHMKKTEWMQVVLLVDTSTACNVKPNSTWTDSLLVSRRPVPSRGFYVRIEFIVFAPAYMTPWSHCYLWCLIYTLLASSTKFDRQPSILPEENVLVSVT